MQARKKSDTKPQDDRGRVSFRLPMSELRILKRDAKKSGHTVSAYLRAHYMVLLGKK